MDVVHAITPGDHFSPRTGSAIPTVVHGLAGAAARDSAEPRFRHTALVDASTMRPRYDSADVIEYEGERYPSQGARVRDAVLARAGVPRRAALRAYRPLARALEARPASIVVAHNAPELAGLLRQSPHSTILYAHNELFRVMSRRDAERQLTAVTAIICVSDDLADRTTTRLPRSLAGRVRVVENGVDTAMFSPSDRRADRSRIRVMFVGRIVPEKGPDLLVEAARRLARDDLEFVIVGSQGFSRDAVLSSYERSLRAAAVNSSVRIVFEPFVDRPALPALLASADIFVAPSRWAEPSGLTVGEAMATGLPVIASSIGGIPGVLGDAGLLVAPADVDALVEALSLLADDEGARQALGAAARQRAVANDWGRSWAQLRRVLAEVWSG